jgi:hypothetical protein
MQRPVEYRDHRDRVWYVSEVAKLKVVSPSIDGPSVALVIRFEREGPERFARWIGGDDWLQRAALDRLFAEAEPPELEPMAPVQNNTVSGVGSPDYTGVGPAPHGTVALWVKRVASMGPDELDDFEHRTFRDWDPASLGGTCAAPSLAVGGSWTSSCNSPVSSPENRRSQ